MSSLPYPDTASPLSSRLLPGVPLVESPLFAGSPDAMRLSSFERDIAVQLNTRGYAVFDFPDPAIHARIDSIKTNLSPRYDADLSDPEALGPNANLRIQDAWKFDPDVLAIAANPQILALLGKLYGRRAFPFQTLNFPVGTQQRPHTDAVHFSSLPERFMCGVWLAMEDITAESGPLVYYPGSHRWPVLSNAMIGRRGWKSTHASAQTPFEAVWSAMVDAERIAPETFLARKGQALIWAANLLHGGSVRTDLKRTRWSQVSHYYFADCVYYTPAFSDEPFGRLDLRTITNVATGAIEPNTLLGETVQPYREAQAEARRAWPRLFRQTPRPATSAIQSATLPAMPPAAKPVMEDSLADLPADFDAAGYLLLNPDVAAAGEDAADHYAAHGKHEGRRYRE
ncbi:phytanoyl-CoA dioxygenase family protein [uncultured Sphingomonas sp.]|uniref:phytanoyl-CoA dioxygenase family protein n=1 Tax=uncultured Sphingomonas sp. TaxID=158754 RepID=UPI0035CB4610